jgi:uncharacterized protein
MVGQKTRYMSPVDLGMIEADSGVWAHPSGALWLAQEETLVVADIHLGYGWAQRRRGQLGPVADHQTCEKLQQLLEDVQPPTLVVAGDLVHAPQPGQMERELIEQTLQHVKTRCRITIVLGNHDRGFVQDFQAIGLNTCFECEVGPFLIAHGDRKVKTEKRLIIGHHHPAYGIFDAAGVKHRLPIFLLGNRAIVLPAFSPFAAGLDTRFSTTEQLRAVVGSRPIAIAASGKKVLCLGEIDL